MLRQRKTVFLTTLAALLLPWTGVLSGQSLEQSAQDIREMAEQSNRELAETREEIKENQVPLSKQLNELEDQLVEARQEYQEVQSISSARNLDRSNLEQLIKSREEQNKYLQGLLEKYIREMETNLQQSEFMRYLEPLGDAQNALTNENLTQHEKFDAQLNVLQLSSDRLLEATGGYTFEGQAIGEGGDVLNGRYGLLGPISTFAVEEPGAPAGITNDAGGSKPSLVVMSPELAEGVRNLVYEEEGVVPLDVTMGDALKMEATEETLLEHLEKGGFTMYPLLGLGALAVLIALFKWIQLSRVSSISRRRFAEMMDAIEEGNMDKARAIAEKVGGPIGNMLLAGIDHLNEPKELIEEVFYEKILSSRTNFMKLLPFIAVTASAAPLLGLLGTVTGMINTFKLITVFGTGDAQSLSGGISEALVTTEWGLIVAIPNLLLYAFLSRKAKGIAEDMDQLAIGFMNRLQESEAHKANGNGDGNGPGDQALEPSPGESGDHPAERPSPKPTSAPSERSKIQAEMVDEAKGQIRPKPEGDPERPDRMGPDTPDAPGSKK